MVPGLTSGADHGCPFCLGKLTKYNLRIGDRFRLLTGFDAGSTGVVIREPTPHAEWTARMDDEPPNWHRRILSDQVVQPLPAPKPPDWAPPLDLRTAGSLDELIVTFCEIRAAKHSFAVSRPRFFAILYFVWKNRLPLEADELWRVMSAHGVPGKFRREICGCFSGGLELLIYCAGRKPVKSRRVEPLVIVAKG
jgi:hypothetical protein